jgi:gliding motility-associated-like protein
MPNLFTLSLSERSKTILFCCVLLVATLKVQAQTGCDCPALTTCSTCQGGLTGLTIQYNGGGIPLSVTAVDGAGNNVPGGINLLTKIITITSLASNEPFRNGSVRIRVLALFGALLTDQTIITSCATPIFQGSTFGNFEIISGTNLNGTPLCCAPSDMDLVKPVFTDPCPNNIQLFTAPGACTATTGWDPHDATDNCGLVTLTGSHDHNGTTFQLGPTTVSYTATDEYNNTATCSFTVSVIDNIAPDISSCPANFNVVVGAGCAYSVPSFVGMATASDNCDSNVTIAQSPAAGSSLSGVGTTQIITLTATDDSGNTDVCTFTITLTDDTDPQFITCPADFDVVVGAGCSYSVPNYVGLASASDNCDTNVIITQSPAVGTILTVAGTTQTITLTATDDSGNTDVCAFTITLTDDTDPQFTTCPADFDVVVGAGCSYSVQNYVGLASASDNCDTNVSITQSPAAGTLLNGVGTIQVITLTATDDVGNTDVCTFAITLTDDTDPQFTTCPADFDVVVGAGCSYSLPSYVGMATASDNCDSNVAITQSPAAGSSLSGVGTTQVITLTATDDSGNTDVCTFTITLTDDTDPQFTTCPADFDVVVGAACSYSVQNYTGLAAASDNCDSNITIAQSPAPGILLSGVGTTQVITLTATDDVGNSDVCTFTITLTDDTDPQFTTCPADFEVVVGAGCSYSVQNYVGLASASDNCDTNVSITQSPAAGTLLNGVGTIQVITLTATDDVGNTDVCTFAITLTDDTDPQFTTCPADFDVVVGAGCSYSVPSYIGLAAASDNCDTNLIITQSPAEGTSLNGGGTTQVITLTATDDSGNTDVCTFTITLTDDTDPQFTTCPANFDVAVGAGCSYSVQNYTGLAAASDNCDTNITITQSPAAGTLLSGVGTTQLITLTATDDAGNSDVCTFTITLIDITAPQFTTCPVDFDVVVGSGCSYSVPSYIGLASDNCDTNVTIFQTPAAGTSLSGVGTTQVITLTATDDAGNTDVCTFTITLTDDTDPQFTTCPVDIDVMVGAGCSYSIPSYVGLASDNCDTNVTITQSPVAGTILTGVGTTQVITLTATDDVGTSDVCTFTITLIDNAAPQFSTCPADFDVMLGAGCTYSVENYTGLANASDNCDTNLTITQSPAAGTLLSTVGTTQVITLTATDDSGNTDVCNFTITLTDDTTPQFTTCPADFDVAVGAGCSYSVPSYVGLAIASDDCDGNVTVTQSPAVGTMLSAVGTTQVITLTATDDSGNTDVCTFTITLTDDTAPQFTTCPADFAVVVGAGCSYSVPSYVGLAAASDNCDTNLTITQSPAAGTLLSTVGTTQVITLTATDDSGNTDVCTFTITLTDDTDPQFTTCPTDFDVVVGAGCSYSVQNYVGLASASDNCDTNVVITQSPAVGTLLSAVGTTQVITLTATDDSGNTDVCTFTIKLTDDTDPQFTTCPGDFDVTVGAGCSYSVANYVGLASASDNCDSNVAIIQSPAAGTLLSGGGATQVITLTAIDDAGNTDVCTFTITLMDETAPQFTTCPGDFDVLVGATCSYSVQNYIGLAATSDNCDTNVTITQSPVAGTLLSGVGTSQVITLTATDDSGNTDVCTFAITLTDQRIPQFTICPADFDVVVGAGCSYSVPSYVGLATVSDNCDTNVSITQSPAVGLSLSGVGTTQIITLTAVDDSGNTDVCTFTITLTDETDPQFTTCPADFDVVVGAGCSYSIPSYVGMATASDNCDSNVAITQSPAAGSSLSGAGTTQVITLTATDDSGNTDVCTFTITLTDDTDPQFTTCPADFDVVVGAGCSYSVQNYTGLAAVSDNCDNNVVITQSPAAGSSLNGVGTTQLITLTATDDSGNTDVCTFTITLTDGTAPQFTTCPTDFDVVVGAACSYSVQNYVGLASASDNCDNNVSITQSPAVGTLLSGVGTTKVITLTATDDSGNTDVCTFTIALTDDTAPQFTTCPADFDVVVGAGCTYSVENYTGLASASDNCDTDVTITQSPAAGELLGGVGTTQVITLTATDDSGNTNVCTFTIMLTDDTDPQFTTCPADFDVVVGAGCSYSVQNYTGLAAASDNCDTNVAIIQSPAAGTLLNGVGTTQLITLTATDDSGNTDVCTFTITLTDDTDPQFTTCPADFDVVVGAGCSYSVQNYVGLASASDNCDTNVSITQSPAVGTMLNGVGTTQVISLTATDDSGNTDVCTFTITLADDTAPQFTTCPVDFDVVVGAGCSYSVQNYAGLASASDNCDTNVIITQSPAAGALLSGVGTTQLITLTATDDFGNTDVCTFTITLTDGTDPQFTTCPADFDVVVGAGCSYSVENYAGLAIVSDNCDSDVTITQSPAVGTMFSAVGTTQVVILTATDDSGNTAVCTFTITLMDDTNPQFTTCPANLDAAVGAGCSYSVQNYVGLASASDNCGNNVAITQSPAAGTLLSGVGTIQLITLTATDDAGNTDVCTFTVTLTDDTAPQFTTCPTDFDVVAGAACSYSMPSYTGLAAASDNCDTNVTITQSPAAGTLLTGAGTTQVITLTATDDSGNTDVCTFTITLKDQTAPQFTVCPADFDVVVGATCSYSVPNYVGLASASDNCDANVTITQSLAVGTLLSGVGTTQLITLTATDDAGYTDVCTFTITLTDATGPQFTTCPADFDVIVVTGCTYNVEDYRGLISASDNCDNNVVITQSPAVGTLLSGVGTTQIITLTATDDTGNATACTFTITLTNPVQPVFTNGPENIDLKVDESGEIPVTWAEPVAIAPCGDVVLWSSHDPGSIFRPGTTEIIYVATDAAGKTTEYRFTVTVSYEELEFDVAKIITPNGDDINDYWELRNLEKFKNNKVVVVDRWGSVVFTATGYNNETVLWRGNNERGVGVPTGTYYYTIFVESRNLQLRKTGFIELVR